MNEEDEAAAIARAVAAFGGAKPPPAPGPGPGGGDDEVELFVGNDGFLHAAGETGTEIEPDDTEILEEEDEERKAELLKQSLAVYGLGLSHPTPARAPSSLPPPLFSRLPLGLCLGAVLTAVRYLLQARGGARRLARGASRWRGKRAGRAASQWRRRQTTARAQRSRKKARPNTQTGRPRTRATARTRAAARTSR
jgi:hypothetical protein